MNIVDEIKSAIADNSEQRGQSWYQLRLGKFTASQIYRLMPQGSKPMTKEQLAARPVGPKGGLLDKSTTVKSDDILADTALTYINEKIAELWTGQPIQNFDSAATEWGIENEYLAREEFGKIHNCTFILNGHNVWAENPNEAGGSSDGGVEGEDAIIEIKCPYNSAIHVKYCQMKSAEDLPKDYFYQCHANMLFSGKSKCYFISYDPRVKHQKNRLFVMEIAADLKVQELIKTKLRAAIAEKNRLLEIMK